MNRVWICDFETTVYEGQTDTYVWASACVEMGTEDVMIFHSIDEQYRFFCSLGESITVYMHNLKFDGNFWLYYLIHDLGMKQAYEQPDKEDINTIMWMKNHDMPVNTFKYSISDMGQWYSIIIRTRVGYIQIKDSLKLLPFSVKRIGQSFGTKHKKLDMEYEGLRYPGCEITQEEREYIANDVLVVKEALEIMFSEGHNKLTIGSCCLSEFKKVCEYEYDKFFPDLYSIPLDSDLYGTDNVGEYIRKSYKGGWCYLAKGKANKIYRNGVTADVNSLYPSVMSSESGNPYPVLKPKFWKGNYIPDEALTKNKYFFIRIRTRFYLKKGYLPFIQIKNSLAYKATEALETSDHYDYKTNRYYHKYRDKKSGKIIDTRVTLTLTMTDYNLLLDHYNLIDFEILDGCYFYSIVGVFDTYIEKYKQQKLVSKGARRELAKLFLNNLYGKLASSTNSSFKVAYLKDDGALTFITVQANDKKPGYIACGSAVTSYARNFTIRTAQSNYYGADERGFIYADTDSIHCDLKPEELKNVPVHDKDFCHWKLEAQWDVAIFTRQKTYIEHVVAENLEPIEEPYYNIKCAGMPDKCKKLFNLSMNGVSLTEEQIEENKYTQDDVEFLKTKRELSDFCVGLKVPGKLYPKRIRGGVLLEEGFYEMR